MSSSPKISLPEVSTADAAAYQRFLGAFRQYWAGPLFQALRRQIDTELVNDPAAKSDFDALLERHPTHQYFAWLERHVQRLKYSGRWGVVAVVEANRLAEEETARHTLPEGLLTLDPALQAPDYYRECDIHQHPGGLWNDSVAAGLIYRGSAGQPGGVVGVPELHRKYARIVLDGKKPRNIVDLGCAFGRGTEAFALEAPDANVVGVDLSEGCLRLAADRLPREMRGRVSYRQADARAVPLPEGSFDVVSSAMLLHELPEKAIIELTAEMYRLLAPGGIAVHLDFLPPADPLLRAAFMGHSRRNNEPFMAGLGKIDFRAAYQQAGFRDVEIIPFEEREGASQSTNWRLPWTIFRARK
ncbi:MAG: class I SAM-dependent methyltransferase [Steroidobacteraceae bacterium]